MSQIMMALGQYRYAVSSATYQNMKITRNYRWASQERLTQRPSNQFIGLGEKTLSKTGVIYPHFSGGLKQVDAMEREADTGRPLLMVDGLGDVWGYWVVLSLSDTRTMFTQDGRQQKQEFDLALRFYGQQTLSAS